MLTTVQRTIAIVVGLSACAGAPAPRAESRERASRETTPIAQRDSGGPKAVAAAPEFPFGEVVVDSARAKRLRGVLGSCDDSGCLVDVQLVEGDKLLDTHALPWRVPKATRQVGPIDATAGIGDPLVLNLTALASTLGEENAAVTVLVQPVRLAASGHGLFVHQIAGFEHIKRARALFVADGEKLAVAWQYEESQSPERTVVEVIDLDADGDDELRVWSFKGPDGLLVDSVKLETLSWNAERRSFEALPAATPSSVVVRELGNEKGARAAHAQLGKGCPEWTLFAPSALDARARKYWIGVVTAHAERAQDALVRAKQCAPGGRAVLRAGTLR